VKPPALRALYICYLSLDDPLTHSQVVAYLAGLARDGHTIHLLTFEPAQDDDRRRALEADLAARGISWHALRYHKRPSLPATIFDALVGAAFAVRLIRRERIEAIHARNHVPAAMALIARRLTGCRLIFDLRGLMAEEYADAGRWRPGGIPFRMTKRVEAAAIRASDAIVVLTRRVREYLFGERQAPPVEVIPCCADIGAIQALAGRREETRQELAVGDRPVLLYVGKFTGWYMEQEMVDFFVAAREHVPGLLFLILTQADREPALQALAARGVGQADYRIAQAPPGEIGRYLAAADAGISFIRPCLSKISSSPTKIGEYLAAGLPVISGTGIGDVDALLSDGTTGVLITEFGAPGYRTAAVRMAELIADPQTRGRCQELARRELSLETVGIPRYETVYGRIAA
jgi:glycosyltransferase involved in cell wall biosynthesis